MHRDYKPDNVLVDGNMAIDIDSSDYAGSDANCVQDVTGLVNAIAARLP